MNEKRQNNNMGGGRGTSTGITPGEAGIEAIEIAIRFHNHATKVLYSLELYL